MEKNITPSWWKRRSNLEKGLLITGLVCLFPLLVLIIVVVLHANKNTVCTTEGCVRSAAEILDNIDMNVNPCDDFYQFACGKFLKQTDLDYQQSKSAQGAITEAIQTQIRNLLEQPLSSSDHAYFTAAKRFYSSCMNDTARDREGVTKIKEIFKQIGGWPILETYWSASSFDWKQATSTLRRNGINFELFIKMSVDRDIDRDKSDMNILYVSNPSFSQSDVENIPLDYMVELAVEFGADKNKAVRDQREVHNMLLNIAKILDGTIKKEDQPKRMTISQLQEDIPLVDWMSYINGILSTSYKMNPSDYIIVSQPLYLEEISELLRRTNKRIVANFMCWYTIQYMIQYLPTKILDRVHHYVQKLHGDVPKTEQWQTCLASTYTRFSLALSAEFVEFNYDRESRDKVLQIIRNLKTQFKKALYRVDWLDESSKDVTREVISTSVEVVVSADEIRNEISETNLYQKIEIINEDKYFETVLLIDFINTNLKYERIKQRAKDSPWSCRRFPTGFDIDYSPRENTFRIPAGLLQGLYFRKDRPNFMNYGSLGSAVAHEISHIFTIAEYRNQGDLRDWWSPQSLDMYDKNARCLSNQYATFYLPEIGKYLNSTATQEEDVADLSGLKIAYEAYINWIEQNKQESLLPGLKYTPKQLFWISAAIRQCAKHSPHTLEKFVKTFKRSPEKFRVNGPLRNLNYFAYDFSCATGSTMNPENKCNIW